MNSFTCTATNNFDDGLTFDDVIKVYELLTPPVFYAVSDQCTKGEVIKVAATDNVQEFCLLHPDDLEIFKNGVQGRRLVLLKDADPKELFNFEPKLRLRN